MELLERRRLRRGADVAAVVAGGALVLAVVLCLLGTAVPVRLGTFYALMFLSAAGVLARAFLVRAERGAWLVLGLGARAVPLPRRHRPLQR